MASSIGAAQRAGIADARRATVADEVEAELVEIRLQAGLVQIIGDDARTGRERRLDGGVHAEAAFDGLLREQTGGEHDAGICVFVQLVMAAMSTEPLPMVGFAMTVERNLHPGGGEIFRPSCQNHFP